MSSQKSDQFLINPPYGRVTIKHTMPEIRITFHEPTGFWYKYGRLIRNCAEAFILGMMFGFVVLYGM